MPKEEKKIVVFTKEPLSTERIDAILRLWKMPAVHIVGVFIEDAIHLPLHSFIFRTLKRIYHGHIYVPEFVVNIVSLFFKKETNEKQIGIDEALKHTSIPIYRMKNIQAESATKHIKSLHADIGLIIGHRILPSSVFSLPKEGTLNVHHGILPGFAGSHTTFWRIVEGFKDVGVTIHKVADRVDSGDILHTKKVRVKSLNTHAAYEQVKAIVPEAVEEAFQGLFSGKLSYNKQAKGAQRYWKPPTFWERIKYRKFLQ